MQLAEALNIYSPSFLKAFMLSSLLFLLYGIINLIDANGYILNFNVLDVDVTSRGLMVYAYLSGYYMLILKIVIALITLFVLTLIIRVAVATVIRIFTPSQNGGGAYAIMQGASFDVSNKVAEAVMGNMRYLLSFVTSTTFITIFLVIIPLFMFFVLMSYSRFYNQNVIKSENMNDAPRIMLTNHYFLMFIISSLFAVGFVFSVYLWFRRTYQ